MTLKEIAEELVAGCREGREKENLARLYAPDAVSVEAMAMPGMEREARGLEAIEAKHAWWSSAMEMVGGSVEGPYLHGDDRFGVKFTMETRNRQTGELSQGAELAIYHVRDGRIVREEFFYAT